MKQTASQLRNLALSKQGLNSKKFGKGLSGTRKAIEHLGYVQIDTLSVVERAHHHVLWSRVPAYDPDHLNQLVNKKQIFEYWYHAASYLPMSDYRFALPNMAKIHNGENRYYTNVDKNLMKEILARVKDEGPIRARDLNNKKNKVNKDKGSWWNWSGSKRALDKLFMQGDLMVCERYGMEKVFDLTERCLPCNIDLSMPSINEYSTYLFETTLRAHGVFTLKQLLHLKTGKPIRDAMQKVLDQSVETGTVKAINYDNAPTVYLDTKALEKTQRIDASAVKILSPFDNAVIHRERLSQLFGFDYTIECYVPKTKRVFGYFCLPLLCGNKLVGRVDCKAHRAEQRFELLSLHLEDGLDSKEKLFLSLIEELQRFADFNKCPNLDAKIVAKFN